MPDSSEGDSSIIRRPMVGVMGSGQDEHADLAEPIGELIAGSGCHLLTGGGRGTMTATARGFTRINPRAGLSIGILRGRGDGRPVAGYPNAFVEIPIQTHLDESGKEGTGPMSRNHINVLSPDLVVALPGGFGTQSEIELATRYGRRIIVHATWKSAFPALDCWESIDQCRRWIEGRLA